MKNPLLKLYLDFMKFGCFTFGGGWSIIAQMQTQYCDKEHLLNPCELMDLASAGNSLPGTMISNVAMLFGYRRAGIMGGLSCLLGMITAPVIIIVLITVEYKNVINIPIVDAMMGGVRASVVPIIICSVYKMMKIAFKNPNCVAIASIVFIMQYMFHINSLLLLAFGIVSGWILNITFKKKGN